VLLNLCCNLRILIRVYSMGLPQLPQGGHKELPFHRVLGIQLHRCPVLQVDSL
jgi:hypothetical protein